MLRFLALFLLLSCAHAQTLVVDDAVDFGAVAPEAQATLVLQLCNIGDRVLRISQVQVSCSCISAETAKRRLAPGEATTLSISFDGRGQSGAIRRTVRIVSNDPASSMRFLRVSAQVTRPLPAFAKSAKTPKLEGNWREGEVVVKFKNGRLATRSIAEFASEKGCRTAEMLRALSNLACLTLHPGESVPDACARLAKDADIAYVQPNYIYQPRDLPNDPDFFRLWALDNTAQLAGVQFGIDGADIQADEAWEIFKGATSGNGAIVAILDNGLDYDHAEFAGQLWDGSDCVDHDGNPLGDCIHGYDYTGTGDKDPHPTNDHGTHVAGIVGARGNNEIGGTGITRTVQLMALRSAGYVSTEFVKSIYFAAQNGATVINASWGYAGSTCSSLDGEGLVTIGVGDVALYDAIADFSGVFVGAAGNSNKNHDGVTWFDSTDYAHDTPCWTGLPNVINVAVSDNQDKRWPSSDWGTNVDIAAPGRSIYSTSLNDGYSQKTGSSMSSPQVVGVAALLWGFRQDLSPGDIRDLILQHGDCIAWDREMHTSGVNFCGSGKTARLNAYRPMAAVATPTAQSLKGFTSSTQLDEIADGTLTDTEQPYWRWEAPTGQGIISHYYVSIDDGAVFKANIADSFFDCASRGIFLTPGLHEIVVTGVNDVGGVGVPVSHSANVSAPLISILSSPASITEGDNSGVQVAVIPNGQPTGDVSVTYLVWTIDPISTNEVIAHGGSLTWPIGTSEAKTVLFNLDNALDQPNYNARFELHTPVNAILEAPVTVSVPVTDDDESPGLLVGDATADVESGQLSFQLSLTEPSGFSVSYDFQTEAITATAGVDFVATSGSSFFPRGATTTSISVPIFNDSLQENREQFRLVISASPINSGRSTLTATGTIIDDDAIVDVNAGWNLVSLPINVSAAARAQLFPNSETVWAWDAASQQFRVASDLAAKQGYWVFVDQSEQATPTGEGEPNTEVQLLPGWNLVGPLEPILPPANSATSDYFGWDSDFFRAKVLLPNQAYWVFAHRATSIRVAQ
ncbi:MAG: hypothetical protein ACI8W8_000698 [Rhodothermales bacterium]|jgi:hypothetical protein